MEDSSALSQPGGLDVLDMLAGFDPGHDVLELAGLVRGNEELDGLADDLVVGVPYTLSAAGFQLVIMPSSVLETMASSE